MFIVVRHGVYDQGVVAVESDLCSAKQAAEKAATAEDDNYHDFDIRTLGDSGEYDEIVETFAINQRFSGPRSLGEKRKWRRPGK